MAAHKSERRPRKRPGLFRHTGGSSAVEFALTTPLFLLLMFGTTAYGTLMSTYSAVQQLTAEGARASVAGLSSSERDQLARTFISGNLASYPMLDPTKVAVTTASLSSPAAFKVTVSYDMSSSFIYTLGSLVPLPAKTVTRSATVQNGGF